MFKFAWVCFVELNSLLQSFALKLRKQNIPLEMLGKNSCQNSENHLRENLCDIIISQSIKKNDSIVKSLSIKIISSNKCHEVCANFQFRFTYHIKTDIVMRPLCIQNWYALPAGNMASMRWQLFRCSAHFCLLSSLFFALNLTNVFETVAMFAKNKQTNERNNKFLSCFQNLEKM